MPNDIAAHAGEADDPRKALERLKAQLPDLERTLGKDHPETLATRDNIAFHTGQIGDAPGALAMFKAL